MPYVRPAVTMKTPLVLDTGSCPVDASNRDSWTEAEREKVTQRVEVRDLEHLEEMVRVQFLQPSLIAHFFI